MAVDRIAVRIAVVGVVHRVVVAGPIGLAAVVAVRKVVVLKVDHTVLVAVQDMEIGGVAIVDMETTSDWVGVVRVCYTLTGPEDTVMMFRKHLDSGLGGKSTEVLEIRVAEE
jgi:hypothetical protein